MLNRFRNLIQNNPTMDAQQASATVRVIGDRASGKTTYMAALARWPNAEPSSPVETVVPFNDEGRSLVEQAQNILEQGLNLAPTMIQGTSEMPDYGIQITLKGQFSWQNPRMGSSELVKLVINCKDYAGEFFSDLLAKSQDPMLEDYLQDCLLASGILMLVDGTAHHKDQDYARSLTTFLAALDRRDLDLNQRRIAFTLAKCEMPELWVQRLDPKSMARARFPRVYQLLEGWQNTGSGQVDYFATSALGMLGRNFPEPNRILQKRDRGGVAAVLKDPRRWRPFGLVAPIYWLCTGQRHKKLDQE